MTDKEILLSRVYDKITEADKNVMITHTAFLSVDEISDIKSSGKKLREGIDVFYYGGIPDAERCAMFFIPECYAVKDLAEYFNERPEDNPIVAVKVLKDRFSSITHRDYLGALMGLGVKREQIGDIVTCESGAYIICLRNIAGFIKDNLKKSGRGTLTSAIVDVNCVEMPDEKTVIKFHSVASLRLDNILCAGFSVPRSLCNEYINRGLVFVNSVRAVKCDSLIKENDKVVLRGKGKIVLAEIIGENKKGRTHINIKHYI